MEIEENNERNFLNRDQAILRNSHSSYVQYFSDKSEQEIWSAFRKGNEAAFAFIYEKYFDLLFNYGKKLLLGNQHVEDLLQDFFIDLRCHRAKLSEINFIKPYLFKSFRRKLFRLKADRSFLSLSYSNASENHFKLTIEQDLLFVGNQISELQVKYLEAALNKLTKRQKEAIFHFYYETFSYQEIAEIMDLGSAKAARNLIYKGLSKLRTQKELIPKWLIFIF